MISKKFLVFSLVVFLLIGCSSPVLAAPVSDSPNSDLGVTVSENKGDPVAVIGKDEFLISKGTVLTGDMLIEGLGLKVVDADGNDLHMPDKIRFGFGSTNHTADEEAAVVNDFFIGQDYANSGINVYAKIDAVPYYEFIATVTTIDDSNVTYPVEDPYRGVVSAIIGQHNIAIPYGSKITGDMIVDNLKVVDAEGNDLGLSDQITFRKIILGGFQDLSADDLAEEINTYFEKNPRLSTEGFLVAYYAIGLKGPATSFSFNFDVSRYYDVAPVEGEPYAITGNSQIDVYVEEGKTPVITGDMLIEGLKVVDVKGNDLGMTDKIIFYKDETPDEMAEYLKNYFVRNGWLSHSLTAYVDGYSEAIQVNIKVRSITTKDDGGTVDKAGTSIAYSTHVENIGWQDKVKDGKISGTEGRSLRLEAIKIESGIAGVGVEYATHVENIGWQAPVKDGTLSGTEARSLRLEAIRIKLTGENASKYDVYYRVHAQNIGWMGWASNGANAGTAGYAYRLEGIEIKVVAKGAPAPGTTVNSFVENK